MYPADTDEKTGVRFPYAIELQTSTGPENNLLTVVLSAVFGTASSSKDAVSPQSYYYGSTTAAFGRPQEG